MELHDKINELLGERHWTYYKLSKISGLPMTTVRNIVSGRNKSTSHENLLRIAYAFDITLNELLGTEYVVNESDTAYINEDKVNYYDELSDEEKAAAKAFIDLFREYKKKG
jgi:transcriptional regulator with XRE-family HTH domain